MIARLTGKTEQEIKKMRYDNGIKAVYKMVDTCAAEFAMPENTVNRIMNYWCLKAVIWRKR